MADGSIRIASDLWIVFEYFAIKTRDFLKSLKTFLVLRRLQNFVVDKLSKPRVVVNLSWSRMS